MVYFKSPPTTASYELKTEHPIFNTFILAKSDPDYDESREAAAYWPRIPPSSAAGLRETIIWTGLFTLSIILFYHVLGCVGYVVKVMVNPYPEGEDFFSSHFRAGCIVELRQFLDCLFELFAGLCSY